MRRTKLVFATIFVLAATALIPATASAALAPGIGLTSFKQTESYIKQDEHTTYIQNLVRNGTKITAEQRQNISTRLHNLYNWSVQTAVARLGTRQQIAAAYIVQRRNTLVPPVVAAHERKLVELKSDYEARVKAAEEGRAARTASLTRRTENKRRAARNAARRAKKMRGARGRSARNAARTTMRTITLFEENEVRNIQLTYEKLIIRAEADYKAAVKHENNVYQDTLADIENILQAETQENTAYTNAEYNRELNLAWTVFAHGRDALPRVPKK